MDFVEINERQGFKSGFGPLNWIKSVEPPVSMLFTWAFQFSKKKFVIFIDFFCGIVSSFPYESSPLKKLQMSSDWLWGNEMNESVVSVTAFTTSRSEERGRRLWSGNEQHFHHFFLFWKLPAADWLKPSHVIGDPEFCRQVLRALVGVGGGVRTRRLNGRAFNQKNTRLMFCVRILGQTIFDGGARFTKWDQFYSNELIIKLDFHFVSWD